MASRVSRRSTLPDSSDPGTNVKRVARQRTGWVKDLFFTISSENLLIISSVISVVVPIRDERDNIEPLVAAVHEALGGRKFEIVCVDDGSTDLLQSLVSRFPCVRMVRHELSRGQSAAILSGVGAAEGEWVVTLDGDGQNDPADIPVLFHAAERASSAPAMVVGWRKNRQDPWVKRISSKWANIAYRSLIGGAAPDIGCGIKLFRRETFLNLPTFDHMHRFLPALVQMQRGAVCSVEVRHRARRRGRSKYGIHDRLWAGIIDLIGVRWLQKRALGAPLDRPQTGAVQAHPDRDWTELSRPSIDHSPSTAHAAGLNESR